jgi:Xaa-Pro aminopeptidase
MSRRHFEELHQLPPRELPFSLEEFNERLTRVRQRMEDEQFDMIYLTAPESMYYLSGYRACWYGGQSPTNWPQYYGIAVHRDHATLIHIDIPAESLLIDYISVPWVDKRTIDKRADLSFITRTLSSEGWLKGRIGMEFWSYRPNRAVSERMEHAFVNEGCNVADCSHILREERRIKSPKEIEYHEKAGQILDAGYNALVAELRPGMTEWEAFGILNLAMHRAGGELAAMPYSLGSGCRAGASGHILPSNKVIQQGELFGVDPCGVYNQYHTNVARKFSLGEPPRAVRQRFQVVAEAVRHMKRTIRPGMTVNEFAKEMRPLYEAAGVWEDRQWVGGYEMGISFPPDWVGEWVFTLGNFAEDGQSDDRTLDENFVCNYENCFHVPGTARGSTGTIDTIVFRDQHPVIPSSFDGNLVIIE